MSGTTNENTNLVEDPICGMWIDPATAAGTSQLVDVTIHFCSSHCKQAFDGGKGSLPSSGRGA
jgi:YHS domain-containing protein